MEKIFKMGTTKGTTCYVAKEGRYFGVVDENDNIILHAKYCYISEFTKGLAIACYPKTFLAKGKWVILTEEFKEIPVSGEYANLIPLNKNIVAFKEKGNQGLWGIMNRNGSIICKPKYVSCPSPAGMGFFEVSDGTYKAFINEFGKQICKLKYARVESFNKHGQAHVLRNNIWYIINKNGMELKAS